MSDLRARLEEVQSTEQDLRDENEKYQTDLADLQSQLTRAVDERDRALEEAIDPSELKRIKDHLNDLAADKASLEAEVEVLRMGSKASNREHEILDLKDLIERLEDKLQAQARDMSASEQDVDRMAQNLRAVEFERNELNDNLAETMAIIQERSEDLRNARDQLDDVSRFLPAVLIERNTNSFPFSDLGPRST